MDLLRGRYDEYDEPVSQGGLIDGLTLQLRRRGSNAVLSEPMRDNGDGTFIAAIPPSWVAVRGKQVFEFLHNGAEFKPTLRSTN